MEIKKLLAEFAGVCQPAVSRTVASVCQDALTGRIPLPPLHLSGYAGLGKTHMVENVLVPLLEPSGFQLVSLPPGFTLGQLKKVLTFLPDKAIVFMDEVHAADRKALNLIKAATETSGRIKTLSLTMGKEEVEAVIDPTKHLFVSASNESLRDSALVGASGRFLDLAFVPYDDKGKSSIFRSLFPLYAPGIELSEDAEKVLVRNVRPFARAIKAMIQEVRIECKMGGDLTNEAGAKKALAKSGYYPNGWRKVHVDILRFCAKAGDGRQVQEIAMGPGKGADRKTVQGHLDELMQGELVITLANGRKGATDAGVKYLTVLDKAAAAAAAKKSGGAA